MSDSTKPTTDGESDKSTDDDLGVSYSAGARGPDREGMVNEYVPEQEDWTAKTMLDVNDPARVAALRNIDQLFPEVAHHQPIIDQFLDDYLKARTSVAGQSRRDYKDIFMSMFGGTKEDDTGSMLAQALASDLDDDD